MHFQNEPLLIRIGISENSSAASSVFFHFFPKKITYGGTNGSKKNAGFDFK